MKKRALVVGSGGARGAHDAGVLTELGRRLPPGYFDGVYAVSSGAFSASYFVAEQPDNIEHVWRDLLGSGQLVDWLNPLRGKNILDLEYLVRIYTSDLGRLDAKKLFYSATEIFYVVANQVGVMYVRPDAKNIFDFLRASAAIPLAHGPVSVDGTLYYDGGLIDPLPVARAYQDGYRDITVIYSRPNGFNLDTDEKIIARLGFFLPQPVKIALATRGTRFKAVEAFLENHPEIKAIRPQGALPPRHALDFDSQRINLAVDIGIQNAREFLEKHDFN